MAKIMRSTDRLELKINDVVFTISPLNKEQKQEMSNCTFISKGQDVYDLAQAQFLYVKYGLKSVKGIEDYHGNEYTLAFDDNGHLTDECANEILTLEDKPKLMIAAWQLLNGVRQLKDPDTGKELKGISLEVITEGK